MQKTQHKAPQYSIAMSVDHGTIVFLKDAKVVGSMSREQSIEIAKGLMDWKPSIESEVRKEIDRPKLSIVN